MSDVDQEKQSNFFIASAALHGLVLLGTGGVFLASLFMCRRRSDRARHAVTWLKVALLFFGLYVFPPLRPNFPTQMRVFS